MATTGIILIQDHGITVSKMVGTSRTSGTYHKTTQENLADACRVLAAWMDIPFEDVSKECQRVHNRDQQHAEIREMVKDAVWRIRRVESDE